MSLERESVGSGTVAAVSRNDVYSFTKPVHAEIVLIAGVGVEEDVHAGRHVRHRGRVRADPSQPNLRQVHLMQGELLEEVAAKGYAVAPGELGENVTTRGIDLLGLPLGTVLRFGAVSAAGAGPVSAAGAGPVSAADAGPVSAVGASGAVSAAGAGLVGASGAGAAGAGESAFGRGEGFSAGAEGRSADAWTPATGAEAVAGVLAVAAATTLDELTAAAAEAVAATAARDLGDDPRPAVILAGLRNPCAQINAFRSGLLKEVVGHDIQGKLIRKAGVMAVVLRGGPIRPGDLVTVEVPPLPHSRLAPV